MSLSISSILLLAPMHKTGMKTIIIVIMVLDVNFFFIFITEIVFNSFGWVISFLRHCMRWQRYFHRLNTNGETKLKSNDKPNELQQQKSGIKEWNRNVLSPTYRQSARVYFWNSNRQVLFQRMNYKNGTVSVWMLGSWFLQLLYFICQILLQFVVHFCTKCIVSFCICQFPIEWLTFRQPIYVIFLNRKPVIGLLRFVLFFSIWTFIEHLTNQTLGCIICRLHFK